MSEDFIPAMFPAKKSAAPSAKPRETVTCSLALRYYGDPCLRRKARPVAHVGPMEKMMIRELIKAMYAYDGVGLAAAQVGIEDDIFVADVGEGPFAVINAEIVKTAGRQTVLEEGCLSLPEVHIKVKRPEMITVRYMNERNQYIEAELKGTPAKVFQHEIDHLNGRMIIDHASDEEKARFKGRLAQLEALCRKKDAKA